MSESNGIGQGVFADFITREELKQVCWETEDMLNGMRQAINIHAEIAMLHRHLLEKFIPAPVLEAAVNEYAEARKKDIDEELALAKAQDEAGAVAPAQVN